MEASGGTTSLALLVWELLVLVCWDQQAHSRKRTTYTCRFALDSQMICKVC